MIFRPCIGQCVRIHYAKKYADKMPHHGKTGIIVFAAKGRGPRNVGVKIKEKTIVVPRGNLYEN